MSTPPRKTSDIPDAATTTLVKLANADVRDVPSQAGGMGAVTSTMRFLHRDTGLWRGGKLMLQINQSDGFDCPGCAWPEASASVRHRFEFCENGAKAVAEEATKLRATPKSLASYDLNALRAMSDFELGQLGRITHPMIVRDNGAQDGANQRTLESGAQDGANQRTLESGAQDGANQRTLESGAQDGANQRTLESGDGSSCYQEISWPDAIALMADAIASAGPTGTALYTSGRTSNEAAFLYQLMGRMLGTNHFPDCSNMCHESSGVALNEVIGVGKGTVSLADFDEADLIFVIGQNPGTNHPRMLTTLRAAAQRGATIVSVNPLREVGLEKFSHPQKVGDLLFGGVALTQQFVNVQIGGDLAFFSGIAKQLFESGTVLNESFLRDKTVGYQQWRSHIVGLAWSDIEASSGVSRQVIAQISALYGAAKSTIACWAMGLTQQPAAVATIQEIVNVMLLRGNLGRPGAGLCPVRGHSNVQGDRTMGITARPKQSFLDALGAQFGFAPPQQAGYDAVQTIHALERDEVSVLVSMGGNMAAAMPDTDRVGRAIARCALTASVVTKLNRTHCYPGRIGLVLPCLGRTESDIQASGAQFVTVEDSMSVVHRSTGTLPPASPQLRSEPWIVASLAAALSARLPWPSVPWKELAGDYNLIRDLIEKTIPGFQDFNRRVREPDGFVLPNSARDGSFDAVGGRAAFTVSALPDNALPAGCLRMMTIRSHDQYNTTVYGLDDRYRGIHNERRVIFMHPADLAARNLIAKQRVSIVSLWSDHERRLDDFIAVPFDIPRGNAATYFPEANPLVPLDSVAAKSNTPTSKSVVVRVFAATSNR